MTGCASGGDLSLMDWRKKWATMTMHRAGLIASSAWRSAWWWPPGSLPTLLSSCDLRSHKEWRPAISPAGVSKHRGSVQSRTVVRLTLRKIAAGVRRELPTDRNRTALEQHLSSIGSPRSCASDHKRLQSLPPQPDRKYALAKARPVAQKAEKVSPCVSNPSPR
jgi:hypothetical protein